MSLTLDEILAREGMTREEWQRARAVVEDYWQDHARIAGWVPAAESSPRPRVFTFPLYPEAECTVTAPLSEEQWAVLMDVLAAAKPGLIAEHNTDTSRG